MSITVKLRLVADHRDVYSDEHIEACGRAYVFLQIKKAGITFMNFCRYPDQIAREVLARRQRQRDELLQLSQMLAERYEARQRSRS